MKEYNQNYIILYQSKQLQSVREIKDKFQPYSFAQVGELWPLLVNQHGDSNHCTKHIHGQKIKIGPANKYRKCYIQEKTCLFNNLDISIIKRLHI